MNQYISYINTTIDLLYWIKMPVEFKMNKNYGFAFEFFFNYSIKEV